MDNKRQDFLAIVQPTILAMYRKIPNQVRLHMGDAVKASYAIPEEITAYRAADQWLQWQLESKEAADKKLPDPVYPETLWWYEGERLSTIPETLYGE